MKFLWPVVFGVACLQGIATLIVLSTKQSSVAHPLITLGVGALILVALRCTAVVPDPELEAKARAAMLDAMFETDISFKVAYLTLGLSKAQWSAIVNGTQPIPSHTRMLALPWVFWQAYLPKLAAIIVAHNVRAMVSDQQERRISA